MWSQFLLENAHFAINLFAALVTFAVFWLYFDAWKGNKKTKEALRILGFLLLSLSFVVHSVNLETSLLTTSIIPHSFTLWLDLILRIVGYSFILVSVAIEKLTAKPKIEESALMMYGFPLVLTPFVFLQLMPPVLVLLITFFYFRRATFGMEAHIRPVTFSFGLLTLFEILSLGGLFRATQNVALYSLVVPLGPLWIIEHLVLLIASIILGRWVFGYLLKQFQTQLFIILTTLILAIFLVTTVAFTSLLLKSLQDESLAELNADAKVLEFALESKRIESTSNAQMVAQNPEIKTALLENDKAKLSDLTENFLLSKNNSFLVITDERGQVLARGEDREKVGDSLSNDILVKRALLGESLASAYAKEGVLAPEVTLGGASPIFAENRKDILGVVILGSVIDSTYLDGMKKATGLEVSLYGDTKLSATTLTGSDGKTRLLGIEEKNTTIRRNVLTNDSAYSGETVIGNTSYLASYMPLNDVDSNPIGMIFVGRPTLSVLHAAGKSIELTFIAAALMILLSIVPSYIISRYLAKQL